ncbi:ferritin-like domain-containing protein [Georgenia sp. Z1491]|uniref:ferritin-like domain-containing protein n=1 Tax=Georgenia sp. Z1491 TaxID=3416707 RepID=UPI003CEFB666
MTFDIDTFAADSTPVRFEDLDMSSFRDDPLPEDSLRCLRYMCDVEYHTVCYLRDLLVTPSSREGDVAGFMTMWNREEFWHGEALAAVLAAHDITVDYDELKARRTKLGWREALSSLKQSVLANLVGADFVATHMLWGAANEWSAVAAYRRMADLERHPVLAVLLRRIAQQETRHVAFYATRARERLTASEPARRVARLTLERFWRPVGTSIMGRTEVRHVMGHLFSEPDGRAEVRRIDQNIARLPGMAGVTVFDDALEAEGVPA